MKPSYSLEKVAALVQEWCRSHHIVPANGQAADEISERTVRYYRTLGLLDAPQGGYLKTFTEKHRLQLIAIRIYQAQGLPLRKIRDQLYGQTEEQLRQFTQQAARGQAEVAAPLALASTGESWSVVPLDEEFLLVSRQSRSLPQAVIDKLRQTIAEAHPARAANINHN